MRKHWMRSAAAGVAALAWMVSLAAAETTFSYPNKEHAVFEITFPDGWKTETDADTVSAEPAEGDYYCVLAPTAAVDAKDALKTLAGELDKFIKDFEPDTNEAQATTVNDIPVLHLEGKAKLKEGDVVVRVNIAVLEPTDKTSVLWLAFGTPEAEKKYDEAMQKVVASIRKPGAAGGAEGGAQTYVYPDEKNAEFSIDFPNAWKVETGEGTLAAMTKDESFYCAIIPTEAKNADAAVDALSAEIDKLVKDFKPNTQEAQTMELNGIPVRFLEGKGKDKDNGQELTVSVAVLTPSENTVVLWVAFGTEEAEKKHEADIKAVIQSIRKK